MNEYLAYKKCMMLSPESTVPSWVNETIMQIMKYTIIHANTNLSWRVFIIISKLIHINILIALSGFLLVLYFCIAIDFVRKPDIYDP